MNLPISRLNLPMSRLTILFKFSKIKKILVIFKNLLYL